MVLSKQGMLKVIWDSFQNFGRFRANRQIYIYKCQYMKANMKNIRYVQWVKYVWQLPDEVDCLCFINSKIMVNRYRVVWMSVHVNALTVWWTKTYSHWHQELRSCLINVMGWMPKSKFYLYIDLLHVNIIQFTAIYKILGRVQNV